MKFILDFDRVLFDTDEFIAALKEKSIDTIERGPALLEAVEEKGIDWTEFIDGSVREFLHAHGSDCVIVSSYVSRHRGDNLDPAQERAWQEGKIERSGLGGLVQRVIVTDHSKADEFAALQKEFPGETITLLDDELEHVRAGEQFGFRSVRFATEKNRAQRSLEGAPPSPETFPTVDSFRAFIALVETWKKET